MRIFPRPDSPQHSGGNTRGARAIAAELQAARRLVAVPNCAKDAAHTPAVTERKDSLIVIADLVKKRMKPLLLMPTDMINTPMHSRTVVPVKVLLDRMVKEAEETINSIIASF